MTRYRVEYQSVASVAARPFDAWSLVADRIPTADAARGIADRWPTLRTDTLRVRIIAVGAHGQSVMLARETVR